MEVQGSIPPPQKPLSPIIIFFIRLMAWLISVPFLIIVWAFSLLSTLVYVLLVPRQDKLEHKLRAMESYNLPFVSTFMLLKFKCISVIERFQSLSPLQLLITHATLWIYIIITIKRMYYGG